MRNKIVILLIAVGIAAVLTVLDRRMPALVHHSRAAAPPLARAMGPHT